MRLVQLKDSSGDIRVAVVEDAKLRLLKSGASLYGLAEQSLQANQPLSTTITAALSDDALDYDPIYNGQSAWRLLPPSPIRNLHAVSFPAPDSPTRQAPTTVRRCTTTPPKCPTA